MEANKDAPFTYAYVEKLLRRKNFGVFTPITTEGRSHSVGVVYAVCPQSAFFLLSDNKISIEESKKHPQQS